MTQRWFQCSDSEKTKQRAFDSFPSFPDAVKDPDGINSKWLDLAHIEPLWAKEWRYQPGWSIGPRVVNDSFWFWFEKGPGWLEIGPANEKLICQPGDIFLVPYEVPHTIGYDGRRPSMVNTIHFQCNLYPNINLLSLLGFPYVIRNSPGAPFARASQQLAREFALQSPGWKQAMRGLILEVLLYIVRYHGRCFRKPAGALMNKYLPRLLPVLEWLESHLHEPELTIKDLARQTGVSEVYLRKLFHHGLGLSPITCIRRCRIERACALLCSTQMNIKEISAQTGFACESFFIHVFRKITGLTPVQYRKKILFEKTEF